MKEFFLLWVLWDLFSEFTKVFLHRRALHFHEIKKVQAAMANIGSSLIQLPAWVRDNIKACKKGYTNTRFLKIQVTDGTTYQLLSNVVSSY